MKSPANQLRELVALTSASDATKAEMMRLIEAIERQHAEAVSKRESEFRETYERLLKKD